MGLHKRVYEIVRRIPAGRVSTYGQIAALAGMPRAARAVGSILHANPEPVVIPCHRVVNREGFLSGAFAFGGPEAQKAMLASEGVEVSEEYKVDLDRFLWKNNSEGESEGW
jgi:methylated-DNA-protein-cysteine methyltransferase-like protein